MKSPKEFSQAIIDASNAHDFEMTSQLCEELAASLYQSNSEFPALEAERIMMQLRGVLYFSLMNKVGDAFVRTGRGSFTVYRQFAQAAIEQEKFDLAIFILNDLEQQTKASKEKKAVIENAEARGLLGRVYKQLFIRATNPVTDMAVDYLKKAIPFYKDVYDADNEAHLWHGINSLTLVCRAAREGLDIEGFFNPAELAMEIINIVDEKDVAGHTEAWDYATAAEACVAIADWDGALKWAGKYVAESKADEFTLRGTIRQFKEVWQLEKVNEARKILDLLESRIEAKKGIAHADTTGDLQKKEEGKNNSEYQANFGDDTFKTLEWYEDGLARCSVVARIGEQASEGIGTGFLLKGSVLSDKLGDNFVLLTNEHVINDDPAVKDTLRCNNVKVVFEKVNLKEVFGVAKTYWVSNRLNLDVAIVQFLEKDQLRINEIGQTAEPFPIARELPTVEKTQRIYIIGHPAGKTLSLSLQDNELLDHEDPKIHYRTPTEHGSSGSPVFNRLWKLIGIHHKTSETMPRLNKLPGTYQANEGIWIRTIISALQEEGY